MNTERKHILVIGGSYFIGRIFVESFSKNHNVELVLMNRGNRPLHMNNITEIKADRHNTGQIESVLRMRRWDGIVDFCAYSPDDIHTLFPFISRTDAHYIFISSAAVYAPTRSLPVKETEEKLSGPQPHLGPASEYGFHKYLAETAVISGCRKAGVPYTILRPTIVYGPYNYAPREQYFFDLILNGSPVVIPDPDLSLFQFVYVKDIAAIIASCLKNTVTFSREYNLSAPELISYARLVDLLGRIIGKTMDIRRMTSYQIDQERIPLPFPLDSHFIFDGSSISRDLEFRYTGFSEGMQQTFEWYRSVRKSRPTGEISNE
jgi:nucleoside-diphosphate-sugar epimerase